MNKFKKMALAVMLLSIPVAGMCVPATPSAKVAQADTLEIAVVGTDSVVAMADTVAQPSKTLPSPLFYGPDGKLMVSTDEGALTVDELVREYYNEATLSFPVEDEGPTWPMVAVVAICFGVPGLVALIALVLILRFQRRKNRERHDIIEHAIDNNYPLPDAFYTRQPAFQGAETAQWTVSPDGDGNGKPVCVPQRDPRKLNSAITLTTVGLAVFLAFVCGDNVAVGFFAGGIPFFIGVGRLIAYRWVPGYAAFKAPAPTYGQPPYVNGPGYCMPQQPQPYPQQPPYGPQPFAPQQGFPQNNQPMTGQTGAPVPPIPPIPSQYQDNQGSNNQPQSYDPNTGC